MFVPDPRRWMLTGSMVVVALTANAARAQTDAKPLSPAAQKLAEDVRKTTREVVREVNDANIRGQAEAMIERAEAFLRSRQDKVTGGWSVPQTDKEGNTPPNLPGISALVLMGMLMDPKADAEKDPTISAGVKYLLNFQQGDGGMYDKILPGYNTALSVSALSRVNTPRAREAVNKGVTFLRSLQWSEASDPQTGGKEAPKPVTREHPFYGGVGYGKHGRPDNSNLNIFIQALQDAGVSPEDEAVQRALVFLRRTQMDDRINDMPYAKGSRQGGFVYATVENAESVDGRAGQSMAGTIEETLSDGTKASRLRAYGSMTYAGFKTYLYAQLPKDDLRVTAAWDWIRRNYTVQENPGMGTDGLYYYYVVFARALAATGRAEIELLDAQNSSSGENRNWRADLVERLQALQQDDGSFKSVDDRWMENNPELITAYSLLALRHVLQD